MVVAEADEVWVGINWMNYVLANAGMGNLTDSMLWSQHYYDRVFMSYSILLYSYCYIMILV